MTTKSDVGRRAFVATGACAALAAAFVPGAEAAWSQKDWTAAEKANVKVVEDFLHAWERGDSAAVTGLLGKNSQSRVAAHNSRPPVSGEALGKSVTQFASTSSVTFTILDTVARGPIVVNNRIDRIMSKKPGQPPQNLHYLGVFFVKDGKIQEWSDYEVATATPI